MNIGYINNFGDYPPKSGSSVHVYQLVKGFLSAGHHVHALQGQYPYEHYTRYSMRQALRMVRNVDVLYLRLGGGLRQDVLSILKMFAGRRIPLVWEINAPAAERMNFRSRIVEGAWRALRPLADAAVCVSDELGGYLRDVLKIRRVEVVPNGSDPQQFTPARGDRALLSPDPERDEFVVLWAGSAQFPWQGIQTIYQVARLMGDRDPGVRFVLVTNPRHLVTDVPGNIRVVPAVDYARIADYMAAADLCLCLYQGYEWSKIGCYNSPLKLFDYMSCARPVIATRMGQIAQVIQDGENGFLTNNDAEDIVSKILYIKGHPDAAAKIGAAARKTVGDYYNWDRAVKQTLTLFEELLHGR